MSRKWKQRAWAVLDYMRARVAEPSSWRGFVWIGTGGFTKLFTPGTADTASQMAVDAATVGMIIAGLVGILFPEQPKPKDDGEKKEPAP